MAYSHLGNTRQSIGDFKAAIGYNVRHLKIAEELQDRDAERMAYSKLCSAYRSLGDYKAARDYRERYLKIAEELQYRDAEQMAYSSLGSTFRSLKELQDRGTERVAHSNLGSAYHSLADFSAAIDYHERHLKIAKEVKDRTAEGMAYSNLSDIYHFLGDYKRAISYHERHLKIAREEGDRVTRGMAYGNLGNAYYSLGDYKTAVSYHEGHPAIPKEVGNRAAEGMASGNLGIACHSLGDYKTAVPNHKRHLTIPKEVGNQTAEGMAYGNLANTYCNLGSYESAVAYHRPLKIPKVADRAGEGKANENLGRCCLSLGNFSKTVENQHSTLWHLLLRVGKTAEALLTADKERARDLMASKYGLDTGSSPLQETTQGVINCLPSNTVFIAVDLQEIIFWVIQKNKVVKFRRNLIDVNSLLDCVTSFFQSVSPIGGKENGLQSDLKYETCAVDKLRDEKSRKEGFVQTRSQSSALKTLYDTMVGPVADLLDGHELVIVPEGPLLLVPFAAFMDSNLKYLSESFKIRLSPSLATLKLMADCPTSYHSKTGALLVGDPCVQEVSNCKEENGLPDGGKDVEVIGRILKTAPLIGKEATKNEVLKRLSFVALVHIAAHGVMETGEIFLSPNPSQVSGLYPNREDSLLTVKDVLSLNLRAKLVVLSCCHSGCGENKAEGMVEMARAFMAAGARSVLVSLWAINVEARLKFMKSFYSHLANGRSASEAVNQAMKCLRESVKFSDVKHWAPFVLIGDDVTLEFGRDD